MLDGYERNAATHGGKSRPWLPATRACTPRLGCVRNLGDRLVGSIINSRLPYLYSTTAVGLIINPHALVRGRNDTVSCIFAADGGSRVRICGEAGGRTTSCLPGCYINQTDACRNTGEPVPLWHIPSIWHPSCFDASHLREGLAYHTVRWRAEGPLTASECARVPRYGIGGETDDQVREACVARMGGRYNELVFDADRFVAALPSAVEAIFYPMNGATFTRPNGVTPSEGTYEQAVKIHQTFLDDYQLTSQQVPLLMYDLDRTVAYRATPAAGLPFFPPPP